jgi:hypothetical protein
LTEKVKTEVPKMSKVPLRAVGSTGRRLKCLELENRGTNREEWKCPKRIENWTTEDKETGVTRKARTARKPAEWQDGTIVTTNL